jgi:hypothetical protein
VLVVVSLAGFGASLFINGSTPIASGIPPEDFAVAITSTAQAGDDLTVTLTLESSPGVTENTFTGTKTIDWSGGTNAPDNTPPTYPFTSVHFTSGISDTTLTAKFFDTTGPNALTATDDNDQTITGTSDPVTITPASLGSFKWTTDTTSGPYTAGVVIGAVVKAYDTYGNLKTDYNGTPSPGWSGLNPSPKGCNSTGSPVSGGTFACPPVYPAFSSGVAQDFTDYSTEPSPGTQIVITDTSSGTVTASSTQFIVKPAAIGSFNWTTDVNPPYAAGDVIAAAVTAYDIYGNVKTDYAGTGFSGLHNSPSGCPIPGGASPCSPSYPTFSNGVASNFTDYSTEPSPGTKITITDGSATASTSMFTVGPAALGSFKWTTPPVGPYVAGASISATAKAYDLYGNLKTDYNGTPPLPGGWSGLHPSPSGCNAGGTPTPGGMSPCPPVYATFMNGVTTGSFVDYSTEPSPGTSLTITDGSVSASTAPFVVGPAGLGSFKWTTQPSPAPAASFLTGGAIAATVKAYDIYGNLKTNYNGTPSPGWSGLHPSPSGCTGGVPTSGGASPCPPTYTTFASGVATGGFIDYRTEPSPGTSLTINDGGIMATSSPFVVDPSDPSTISFGCAVSCRQPVETQVNTIIDNSLVPPGVRALVSDAFGNAAYNAQVNVFLDAQAVAITGNPTGGTFKLTYNAGQTAAIPFNATATQVQSALNAVGTVSGAGGVTVTGGALPGLPMLVSFNQSGMHNLFTAASSLTGGSSPAVTITRSAFTGGSTTTVTATPATANPSGIAIFNNLTIPTIATGYRISASASRTPTSGITANGNSVPFTVAQTVNPCTTSCSALASVPNNTTVNVSVNGTQSGSTRGVALFGAVIPPGVCPGFTPVAGVPLSFVNLNLLSTGGLHPTFTITWTLAKSIVNAQADNGAAHYNICVGAVDTTNPQNSPPELGWITKAGTRATAVPDPLFGVTLFWGIAPDCKTKGLVKGNPCVVSRSKDPAGNLIFQYQVGDPYDPNGSLG